MDKKLDTKICKHLLGKHIVLKEDLEEAEKRALEQKCRISEILLKSHKIKKTDFLSASSIESDTPPIDLSRIQADSGAIKLIPRRVADMYKVVPLSRMGKTLTVAMADPLNIFTVDDLGAFTKLAIMPVIADRESIQEAIARFYDKSAEEEISQIVDDMSTGQFEMVEESGEDITSDNLLKVIEETPVIKLTNTILSQGVKEGASDILIEPMDKYFRIRYRIDGILRERQMPPKKYHAPLVSRLKVMSSLNIAERRLPQDGRFQIKVEDRKIDFRLSILPSISGEKVCLRILDKDQVMVDINRLGLYSEDKETIIEASENPHGMILACGPTGAGKSTTLYSVLKHVDSPGKNLVTVEDPVEYEIAGINQVNVQSEIGLTFAGSLRAILRQDPDVVLIGEIRDYETVDIAIKAALTGHLVLSTLHTNTASGSVVRLINMGVEPFLIASSVILIIAQRLVRKLCLECRKEYLPDEKTAEKYSLLDPEGKPVRIYKPVGCDYCMNTGYKGRAIIVECLKITPSIRDLLFRRADEPEIEKEARREGMRTLRANGIENVKDGITSLEEVIRVTVADRDIS